MGRATVILLITSTLCASSARPANDGLTIFEGNGCFVGGFEANSFVKDPPENTEFWLVSEDSDPRFFEQFTALATGRWSKTDRFSVSVRIRGSLSEEGHYGHLSGSPREITIASFSEMRPYVDGNECYTSHKMATLPPNNSLERTREG
jgi:hypothetical protein